VPDGSRDLTVEKALLLESGFDELHGVDWQKGCYMGQELTARTKYRGLIKRRLFPVKIDGPLPPVRHAGPARRPRGRRDRSGQGDRAIAMLQIEAADGRAGRRKAADFSRAPGLDENPGNFLGLSPSRALPQKCFRRGGKRGGTWWDKPLQRDAGPRYLTPQSRM
jgi:folate-binding protein YgfZ